MQRMRAKRLDDSGFTLIELLVVMIIIGILASIAIPVFLAQRAKARDTSTKADVSRLGKEVASYFVDGTGTLSLAFTASPNSVALKDGTTTVSSILLSSGTASSTTSGLSSSTAWCVSLQNTSGQQKTYKYSALNGLEAGVC